MRAGRVPLSYIKELSASATVRVSSTGDRSGGGEEIVRLTELRRLVPGGQSGQGLAEYALILALVGVAAVVALTFLGSSISSMMSTLGNAL